MKLKNLSSIILLLTLFAGFQSQAEEFLPCVGKTVQMVNVGFGDEFSQSFRNMILENGAQAKIQTPTWEQQAAARMAYGYISTLNLPYEQTSEEKICGELIKKFIQDWNQQASADNVIGLAVKSSGPHYIEGTQIKKSRTDLIKLVVLKLQK